MKKGVMVAGLCVAQLAAACDYEDPVVPDADTCEPTPSVAALPLPPLEGITLTQRWAPQTMDWCRTSRCVCTVSLDNNSPPANPYGLHRPSLNDSTRVRGLPAGI